MWGGSSPTSSASRHRPSSSSAGSFGNYVASNVTELPLASLADLGAALEVRVGGKEEEEEACVGWPAHTSSIVSCPRVVRGGARLRRLT